MNTEQPPHNRFICLATLVLATFAGGRVEAGELQLRPSISVGEEYTDNIRETADGRKTEYTTRVRPSAVLGYRAKWFDLDTTYGFDYRHYARGTRGDEEIHNVDLKATAQLVENFIFLDLTDALHRTTVNVARDVETESLVAAQTTRNIASVVPFLLWHPTDKAMLKTGYRYDDTRYWEGSGIDKRENGAFAELAHQVSERFSISGGYTFARGETSTLDYDRHDVIGGFKYSYADNCFLFGSVGNSWQSFSRGTRTSYLLWDVGISHDFRFLQALLETKVQDVQDPLTVSTRQVTYTGRLDKPFARGAFGLSSTYAEYFVTQTGDLEHRRLSVTGTGRYDIMPRLSVSASVTADRFSHTQVDDYPYRLTASGAVNYGFYNDYTALLLSYTYRNDRHSFDSTGGDKVTNRVLLEIKTGL